MRRSKTAIPGLVRILLPLLVLAAGGCTEKITGPGPTTRVNVSVDLKAGPAVGFRLTVSGADMDTIRTDLTPIGNVVVTAEPLEIPSGPDRRFLAEALDTTGAVLYSGETVIDVIDLVPLVLSIDMAPVAPLLYMNPHFSQVALGSEFSITVNANDLPGVTNAGIGLSLFGFAGYKLAEIAVIDTVVLAPAQVELGSSLSYQDYGFGEIYFTVSNEGPIVDAEGDGALVVVRCSTQDTWPGQPVDLTPGMYIETLSGYLPPLSSVYIDNALYRLDRERKPESYLGGAFDDEGVALVPAGGGATFLAGTVASEGDLRYLARLGADGLPVWQREDFWCCPVTTSGLCSATGGGLFVSGAGDFSGGAVMRVDQLGVEVWTQDLANLGSGSPYAVATRPGGGCIAAGSWPNDGLHFYLAAFDAAGYVQHYAPTDFNSDQQFRAVVALDDDTFVAAGYEQPFSDSSDAVLARYTLGATFNEQWLRRHGGTGSEAAFDLMRLGDGGFLMVGVADTLGSGNNDLYVVRTDSEGLARWSRTFGTTSTDEVGYCVTATSDGAFVAAGSVADLRQNRDVYVVKFDGSGNMLWENRLGGSADDVVMDIRALGAGFLLTGSTNPGPIGQRDILVLRLGGDGKRLAD